MGGCACVFACARTHVYMLECMRVGRQLPYVGLCIHAGVCRVCALDQDACFLFTRIYLLMAH